MEHGYAPLWRRALAGVLDALVVIVILLVLALLLGVFIRAAQYAVSDPAPGSTAPFPWPLRLGLLVGVPWLYFALFESSGRGASPGKRVMGLAVTDLAGARLSFARATLRTATKAASILTVFVGFLAAARSERRQALHDLTARSVVLRAR